MENLQRLFDVKLRRSINPTQAVWRNPEPLPTSSMRLRSTLSSVDVWKSHGPINLFANPDSEQTRVAVESPFVDSKVDSILTRLHVAVDLRQYRTGENTRQRHITKRLTSQGFST